MYSVMYAIKGDLGETIWFEYAQTKTISEALKTRKELRKRFTVRIVKE